MARFSETSLRRLQTVHDDLKKVLTFAIHEIDFGVACGHRSIDEQFELFKKGRIFSNGKWIVSSKGRIVTYCDGSKKVSKHNHYPSYAVDLYGWKDGQADWSKEYLTKVAGVGLSIAKELKEAGEIKHEIIWGGHWDMGDFPHFEIK